MTTPRPSRSLLKQENKQLAETLGLFQERIAELEFAMEDVGWRALGGGGDRDFSRTSLTIITRLCRINYLKNPLINHAVEIQRNYVFGHPVSISAKDDVLNECVQGFLDDPKNRAEFTDPRTMAVKEVDLQVNANLFFPLFTNSSTGAVTIRSLPFDEVTKIITDPDDGKTPWFYKREWQQVELDLETGEEKRTKKTAYYPDWRYEPEENARRRKIGKADVKWDSPVMHVKVGGLSDMLWGVPEVYPALDWAKAVKQDLEDYATIKRALARYALSLTVKGGKVARAAAKEKLESTFGVAGSGEPETNPPAIAGSVWIQSEGGAKLEPMRNGGATINPDEGRAMRLMVAAGTGIPETMLLGDADVGNLATASTLDRPTELKMTDRQTFWKGVIGDLLDYVIRKSVEASSGLLHDLGKVEKDAITERLKVVWNDKEMEDDVEIVFHDVVEHDPEKKMQALVEFVTLGGRQPANVLPDIEVTRLGAQLLGLSEVDAIIDALYPDGDATPPTGNIGAPQPAQLLGPDGSPLAVPPGPGGPPTPPTPGGKPKPAPVGPPQPLRNALAEAVLIRLGQLVIEQRIAERKNGDKPEPAPARA